MQWGFTIDWFWKRTWSELDDSGREEGVFGGESETEVGARKKAEGEIWWQIRWNEEETQGVSQCRHDDVIITSF